MPRIPLTTEGYEPQGAAVRSIPATDVFRAPEIVDTSGGIKAVANALVQVGAQAKAERDEAKALEERATVTQTVLAARERFTTAFEQDAMQPEQVEALTKARLEQEKRNARALKLSPAAASALDARLSEVGTEFGVRAIQHAAAEARRRAASSFDNSLEAGRSTVLADPRQYETVVQELRDNLAVLHGKVTPEQEEVLQKGVQKLAAYTVQGEIERDPRFARTYLGERLGIPPGGSAADGFAPAVAVGDASLYGALAQVESNNRHTDDAGKLVRGPANASGELAIGRLQILPSTGKAAAAAAGEAWDAERFETDEGYYTRIAKSHLNRITARFSGNVSAIAAAWNMGEGAAAAWVTGKPYKTVSGKEWTPSRPMDPAAMPKETREYIGKVYASLGVAPPGAAPLAEDALPATALRNNAGPFRDLTASQTLELFNAADVAVRQLDERARQASEIGKATFAQATDDRRAALKAGEWVALPPPSEYAAAFGPERGAIQRRQDEVLQGMAADFAALKTATPEQIGTIIEKHTPKGAEDREARQEAFNLLQQEAADVLTRRAQDPMGVAVGSGIGGVKPLDLNTPGAFEAELRKRVPVATMQAKDYGAPFSLLTRTEAAVLGRELSARTSAEQVGFLGRIRMALPDDRAYQSVMQALRPDSPVTALAGSLLYTDGAVATDDGPPMRAEFVARRVLEGERLLNGGKATTGSDGKGSFPLPSDDKLRREWAAYVGDAYRGAPEVEGTAYQAFRAFYAAEAAQAGRYDGSLNTAAAKRAALAVTGGVIRQNGAAIVLPWGIGEDEVRDAFRAQWRDIAAPGGRVPGVPFESVTLLTIADGKYAVHAGMGPLRDAKGAEIVLTVERGTWVREASGQLHRIRLPGAPK